MFLNIRFIGRWGRGVLEVGRERFVFLWLMPTFLMMAIRIPWLAILGVERFFLPPSEVELYLGQTVKYVSIIVVMVLIAVNLGFGLKELGLSSRIRVMLSEMVTGGVFALFYMIITWLLTLAFFGLLPREVESISYNMLFGFVIPRDKALEFATRLNPWIYAAYMTVVPALVEEVYFRGYSMAILRRVFKRGWLINLAQASLFSVLHWYRGLLAGMLPMAIFGILFGYVTIRNGYRLTSALTGHFVTNMFSAAMYIRGLSKLAVI